MVFTTKYTLTRDRLRHERASSGLDLGLLWVRSIHVLGRNFGSLGVPNGNAFSTSQIYVQPRYRLIDKVGFWNWRNLAGTPLFKVNQTRVRHLTFNVSLDEVRAGETVRVQLFEEI